MISTIMFCHIYPVFMMMNTQASDAGLMIAAQLESIDSNPIGSKPTTLTEGEHSLVYRATDAAGNTDTCSFDLQVKGESSRINICNSRYNILII